MKQELLERRSYMLNHFGKFFDYSNMVTDTAEKFGISENTVKVDWFRRSKWISFISGFKDRSATIDLLINKQLSLLKDLEILKFKADNDNARVGACRTQAEIGFRLIDLLREIWVGEGGETTHILKWQDMGEVNLEDFIDQVPEDKREELREMAQTIRKYRDKYAQPKTDYLISLVRQCEEAADETSKVKVRAQLAQALGIPLVQVTANWENKPKETEA